MHGAQRKAAPRADAPELLELEHFAVAVQAEDAAGVGHQHAELAGLIGVVVVFLGLQEEGFLQQRVQLDEGVEHLVLAAQQQLVRRQRVHGLAQHRKVRHGAGHATQLGPAGVSTLKSLLLASKRCDRRVSPKVTSVSAAIAT
jgi:hypothetical protein